MDIAMMSIINSNAKIQSQVSLAVTKMAMDTSKINAINMNNMIQKSVDPNIGQNLDVRA